MSNIEKVLIFMLVIFVIVFVCIISRYEALANPVEVKISWDADETETDTCDNVCIQLGGPKSSGAVPDDDISTYVVFTDTEFLNIDCSFALANTFQRSTLTQGGQYYSDRDYTLTEVPEEFIGFNSIMLPNNQRANTDTTDYLKFAVKSGSNVYIAFDSRITTLPSWMSEATNTGKKLLTSLDSQAQMDIYVRQFYGENCFCPWQHINFYARDEGGEYDFENSLHVFSQSYVDGKSTPTNTVVTVECENFVVTNKQFILRSGAMVGNVAIESVDSDEALYECDMTRPEKTLLSMNETGEDYVFVWTDTGERTYRYQLQYSFRDPETDRGGYVVIRTVDAPELTVSVPVSEVQTLMGENDTIWFTMVSITKPMIYSRWTEQDVRVDKSALPVINPVSNIRILR